jgi:hypothetical protein
MLTYCISLNYLIQETVRAPARRLRRGGGLGGARSATPEPVICSLPRSLDRATSPTAAATLARVHFLSRLHMHV